MGAAMRRRTIPQERRDADIVTLYAQMIGPDKNRPDFAILEPLWNLSGDGPYFVSAADLLKMRGFS
jgi:hypothetical protein